MTLAFRSSGLLVALAAITPAAFANNWQKLVHQPSGTNASTMFLLMDGRVLMNDYDSVKWWILTPDANGSYLNGTWSATPNAAYSRLYYASGVLRDGRVIVAGGEYGTGGSKVEIYDPVANTWTTISEPSGWGYIGDTPSMVLADGRFMLGNVNDSRTAIYDPPTNTWTASAAKLNPTSLEETWTLLPDGTVLSEDCDGHPHSQLYDPATDQWVDLGDVVVDLVDSLWEIGAGMMMYDGRAWVIGATPHSAHYTPSTTPGGVGTWAAGGDPPKVNGMTVSADDAPAAMLPNGHVLCPLGVGFSPPTYFFEYDGTTFIRAPDPPNNGGPAYDGRMVVLPSGKVLFANGTIYLYNYDGGPDAAWKPTVTSVATDLIAGESYDLIGTQLNGLTTANSYGDECGVATNYPIVRLKNSASGHIFYCRAHDPSTMAIATGSTPITAHFVVPAGMETGPATLEVRANGLASDGVSVIVRDPIAINFDALATGVVVNTQFAAATFSSQSGYENWTVARSQGNSLPNAIATGPASGGTDGTHDTCIDFPCPVASLTFKGIGIDDSGTVATVNVFELGVQTATVPVTGLGTPSVPVRVDLTWYHNVTRIEIVAIADSGGIAWDDFRFCLGSSASWSNYGVGFPGTNGVPSFTLEQNPILGTTITADLANSSGATTIGLLLLGDTEAFIPTHKGGDFLLIPTQTFTLTVDAAGTTIDADIDDDPAICGLVFYSQALEIDAGAAKGLSFTAGLKLVLGY